MSQVKVGILDNTCSITEVYLTRVPCVGEKLLYPGVTLEVSAVDHHIYPECEDSPVPTDKRSATVTAIPLGTVQSSMQTLYSLDRR